jgi:hypothetical protein
MKIEAGKKYKMRNGEEVGPMVWERELWVVEALVSEVYYGMWLESGASDLFDGEQDNDYDLVEEVQELYNEVQ